VKLAYVITAHKNPRQLRRLLHAIYVPGNTYVLHVDRNALSTVHAAAGDFAKTHPNCKVIVPESIIWGSWRLANAQIRAVREALRISSEWSYCLNLTAQDYPLRTHEQISEVLEQFPGKNYLETLRFAEASEGPRKRLEHYWFPWRGRMTKSWRRGRQPDFEVYWGSNYFALTREACVVLSDSVIAKRMTKTFRFSLCADELIFQNILMHSPLKETIVSKTFRKLVWAGGSHPKTFTIADKDELLSSDAFFARKFDDEVAAAILDVLDERLKSTAKTGTNQGQT
jgi:hypothetical protein